VTNTDRVPQRTPLAIAVSIWPLTLPPPWTEKPPVKMIHRHRLVQVQFGVRLTLFSQFCLKPPGCLLQTVGPSSLTGWRTKEQVADPHARPLKPRAQFLRPPKFGGQLAHDFHPGGLIRRASQHQLHSRGYGCPKRGELPDHPSMAEGSDPHPHI
jgi:hypothetical protein